MFAVADFNVAFIFVLTLLSLLLCIVYGVFNWNKDGDISGETADKEEAWDEEEKKIEEEL